MSHKVPTVVDELPADRRQFDYIIVGGGTAGCVVAARIAENLPEATVLVIEGGANDFGKEEILNLRGLVDLWGSDEYDYGYYSVPQPNGTTLRLKRSELNADRFRYRK